MTIHLQSDPEGVEEDRSVASLPTVTSHEELVRRFRPIQDQLLLELEALPKMVGLIAIPETVRNTAPRWAKVLKAGKGCKDVEEGDRVCLTHDPGWELSATLRVLREGAVLMREPGDGPS